MKRLMPTLSFAFATTTILTCSSLQNARAQRPEGKPNIVILFIDDLGYGDIGCFGNERTPTPHIDSIAENGVRCTMSYITNPPCSPSRSSLITGMYAQRFGKSGMARGLPIPDDHPTMAEFLKDAGYVTGQIGKWDLGSPKQGPQNRGFTEVARYAPGKYYDCIREDGTPVYRTELDGEYLAEFVERNKEKPFFMYFSPFAIHSPLQNTPKHYCDRVKGGKGTPYEGAVVALDDAIGKFLEVLDKYNLRKDTLIMFTGDNGPNLKAGGGGSAAPYRGGKFPGHTQYDGWVHTPSIVSWPGTLPKGKDFKGLTCTLDFYATAAAAAGRSAPERCDGINLLPFLKGDKTGDVHNYLYWHNVDPTDHKHRNIRAVRNKNWRMVKYPDGWHLFDLKKDPKETKDIAQLYPEVISELLKKYSSWTGTLPPPKAVPAKKTYGKPRDGWGWMINGKGGTFAPQARNKKSKQKANKKK